MTTRTVVSSTRSCVRCFTTSVRSREALGSAPPVADQPSSSSQQYKRSSIASISNRKKREDLSRLLSLYHSSTSFPDARDEKTLFSYIDDRLLSSNKTRGQSSKELVDTSSPRSKDDFSDYPEMADLPDVADLGDFAADLGPGQTQGGARRQPAWRPFASTATLEARRRGRQIVDALHGTVNAHSPGVMLVSEVYQANELWMNHHLRTDDAPEISSSKRVDGSAAQQEIGQERGRETLGQVSQPTA